MFKIIKEEVDLGGKKLILETGKIAMKFLPKLIFVKDESFDYAEKIENLIKQTQKRTQQ